MVDLTHGTEFGRVRTSYRQMLGLGDFEMAPCFAHSTSTPERAFSLSIELMAGMSPVYRGVFPCVNLEY